MILILLRKDFRRTFRNPWPWIMNLALPILITAIFGLAFGSKDGGASVARIKFAVVDEDEAVLGSILRSGFSQGDAAKFLDPVYIPKEEALNLLKQDKLSALLVIPRRFTSAFLSGETNLALQVIKNPAQSYYPAIIEEMTAVLITGLNALSRNFASELPILKSTLTNELSFAALSQIFQRLEKRTSAISDYLTPPLVTFQSRDTPREKKDSASAMTIFAYILPGMAGAFLLFLADHSMRDIHKERRGLTLDRLRTITTGTGVFVTGKVLMTAITVLLGSVILFGCGSLMFGVNWRNYSLLALICAAYSIFAAGFMAMLVALLNRDRRSESLNSIILFAMAFAGGSYIQADLLPRFVQDYICPWMPNFWFTEAVRGLVTAGPKAASALQTVLQLGLLGVVLAIVASVILNNRLRKSSA